MVRLTYAELRRLKLSNHNPENISARLLSSQRNNRPSTTVATARPTGRGLDRENYALEKDG